MTTSTLRKTIALADIGDLLGAEVLCAGDLSVPIERAGAADLMSDVLALSTPGMLLWTGLVNAQVIRTSGRAGMTASGFRLSASSFE